LEASAYDLRRLLEDHGHDTNIVAADTKAELLNKVEETINWIYDNGKPQPQMVDYTSLLEYFAKMSSQIKSKTS
jgi:hypothetical protein